jgi:hypothetical protein
MGHSDGALLSRRPLQVSASEQVHVQVKDGLSGARADVKHGSIAILDAALPSNLRRRELAFPDQLGVLGHGFFQPVNVLLGDNQDMGWSLGINIVERVGMLVFVDFLGRDFPANDAAKQTVVHDTAHSSGFGDTPRCSTEVARTGKARAYYIRSGVSFAVRVLLQSESIFDGLIQDLVHFAVFQSSLTRKIAPCGVWVL